MSWRELRCIIGLHHWRTTSAYWKALAGPHREVLVFVDTCRYCDHTRRRHAN